MRFVLSVDGGGSKLKMLLFNEDMKLLGQGNAGGVNVNSTTAENARENVVSCLTQVFASCKPTVIDRLYALYVGPVEYLLEELGAFAEVREVIHLSEPEAALMAGALWSEGLVALSGTGSDVFLIAGDMSRPQWNPDTRRPVVGGWGPIIGDDGSGVWIGQQAIRAAVSGLEGWTEPTLILELIRQDWKLENDWDMVEIVYRSPAPFRQVASLTPIVGKAAHMGDKVALSIVREAGELMAEQTLCLFRRFEIPAGLQKLVCCGGGWKTHPLMFERFRDKLLAAQRGLTIRKPLFEHIMAGLALEALSGGSSEEDTAAALQEKFPDLCITW
jgi:N-acetylglucosamine kinase-like BadF-type ATPase